MDPKIVERKDGKAFGVTRVEVSSDSFIHSCYDLHLHEDNRISTTGLLKVFELNPRTPDFPTFIGRWDERADRLDIDISGVSRRKKSYFTGHHPVRLPGDNRSYKIDIRIPGIRVFNGVLSFGLHRELVLTETTNIVEGRVAAEVI